MKLQSKHLLSGAELSAAEIIGLLNLASELKQDRFKAATALNNKHLALVFEKPSLRTRFSFMVAMNELGGKVVESVSQTRKAEEPEDQIRVLQGYCHALMIRAHEDSILEKMCEHATIPIINGLTELFHPCQTLADLLTLKEAFLELSGLTICYIGDGNNVLHSLLLMAPKLGVNVHYCCPQDFQPNSSVLQLATAENYPGKITAFENPQAAVKDCHAVYTDVWTSMGFAAKDENAFSGYQVNEALMAKAKDNAIFLHCMPMERGKEVSTTLPDQPCSAVFQQSENRMHVQKALLLSLLG